MKKNEKGEFHDPEIVTDPFGSYTGNGEDIREVPVQDADDL